MCNQKVKVSVRTRIGNQDPFFTHAVVPGDGCIDQVRLRKKPFKVAFLCRIGSIQPEMRFRHRNAVKELNAALGGSSFSWKRGRNHSRHSPALGKCPLDLSNHMAPQGGINGLEQDVSISDPPHTTDSFGNRCPFILGTGVYIYRRDARSQFALHLSEKDARGYA
nr:hypothetical protein [Arthrobacter pascens]